MRSAVLLSFALALAGCGTSTGGAGGGAPVVQCPGSVAVEASGKDTGYATCASGIEHRPAQKNCPSKLPRATACSPMPAPDTCGSDSDCTSFPNGMCNYQSGPKTCSCSYGCVKDIDCGQGSICVCGADTGLCTPATCTSDADCPGSLCASIAAGCPITGTVFACITAADACVTSDDCDGGTCTFDGAHRVCSPGAC